MYLIWYFAADEVYYRAHILEVKHDGFLVHFIDYGNKELVTDLALVRPLLDRFQIVAPQAIPAALAGKLQP